jgi:predicted ribonuclease toxin of YeeF-YezG toxin-antitoxin module
VGKGLGKFSSRKSAGKSSAKCPLKSPIGKSTKAKTGSAKKTRGTYDRPSGFRKGVRDQVWNAAKGKDGKVRDPLTGKVMKKSDAWDMGHKPGYEFRKHKVSAAKRKITRKKFLDEHNDSSHYQPELPSSNRSHAGEDMTGTFLGGT